VVIVFLYLLRDIQFQPLSSTVIVSYGIAATSVLGLMFAPSRRVPFFLVTFSCYATLFCANAYLAYDAQTSAQRSFARLIAAAGPEFDRSTRLQVLRGLGADGVDAVLAMCSSFTFPAYNGDILPLGG
jgi:hypothetical protein